MADVALREKKGWSGGLRMLLARSHYLKPGAKDSVTLCVVNF